MMRCDAPAGWRDDAWPLGCFWMRWLPMGCGLIVDLRQGDEIGNRLRFNRALTDLTEYSARPRLTGRSESHHRIVSPWQNAARIAQNRANNRREGPSKQVNGRRRTVWRCWTRRLAFSTESAT